MENKYEIYVLNSLEWNARSIEGFINDQYANGLEFAQLQFNRDEIWVIFKRKD